MTARDKGSPHYLNMNIQPWDVIDTWPLEQQIGFYRGNLLKYAMRMGSKDAAPQEIAKAEHYAQKLQEVLKRQPQENQMENKLDPLAHADMLIKVSNLETAIEQLNDDADRENLLIKVGNLRAAIEVGNEQV